MENVTDCYVRFVKETNFGVLAKLPPYSVRRAKRRPHMNRKTWRMSSLAHKRVRNAYTQLFPRMTIRFVEM